MARVKFDVTRRFDAAPRRVWDELVDWPAHGAWIPATRIDAGEGDPTAVGYTFTAWSGYRPFVLEDRMRVARCDWDDGRRTGVCAVDKLGPVLGGTAGFTVRPDGDRSVLEWHEDVTVTHLPNLLSPLAARIGAVGFAAGFRSLDRVIRRTQRDDHIEVRITCDSAEEARRISDRLIERRLAACVHSSPIASTYEWEGTVRHDEEIVLSAVTRAGRFEAVAALVADVHSYELPAITTVEIGGSSSYLAWVDRMVADIDP